MSLLVAALAICVLPGVADAKKKRDKIGLATYNLYLGSDLADATAAGTQSRTDLFADEVGFVLKDVDANNFNTRSIQIAKDIKKRKIDLIGLQEAALWKVQIPTDATPVNPNSTRAGLVTYDYVQQLLEELNEKAKSKKQCAKQKKKAKSTPGGKDNKKAAKCYRGYKLVVSQQEADLEFFGDFDNNPGPDGVTFDVSNSAVLGGLAPSRWLDGNDDTGNSFGEPPAAQCADGKDNDNDGLTDYGPDPLVNEESGPAAGDATPLSGIHGTAAPYDCESRADNSETDVDPAGDPSGLPQDANFDHHAFAGNHPAPIPPASPDNATPFCAALCPDANPPSPISYDGGGQGLDAPGVTDCQDSSSDAGPADGTPGWPFTGYGGDRVPVCMFHGIDGDLSLTMRDAIIARKGFGVKTKNSSSANYSNKFQVSVFGGASTVNFIRGWTATEARIRGKKFKFVNTHLESESNGSIREDQASELIAPGGPATDPRTVLVGDLNSDPNRAPVNLPDGDGGSNIAINTLAAGGFSMLTPPDLVTGGHGELLSDQSNTLDNGFIDHILTNNPGAIQRKGKAQVIDSFANGLWNSDHGGVFVRIKGKKRK